MSVDSDLLDQLMASFREELSERLAAINAGLLALEQEPSPSQETATVEELFRHVHSLKGAARAVNLKAIEELAHGMEDVFGAAKRGTVELSPGLFDLLYQGIDLIGAVMAGVERGKPLDPALDLPGYLVRLAEAWRAQPIQRPRIEEAPPTLVPPLARRPAAVEPAAPVWAAETIRVPTARLDDLMAQAGELLVTQMRVTQQLKELQELQARVARWQREWQRVSGSAAQSFQHSGNGAQLPAFLEQNEDHLRSLSSWLEQHMRRVAEDAARLTLTTDQLQEGIKQARMLPLATLVAAFRRMVRDLAREKGVEVVLEVQGADTEVDKQVLEHLKDPLMHMVRNCIDHGIEPPAERSRRGKPPQGTIRLSAERRGSVIAVEVTDDGAGINIEAVREAALRRNIIGAEAAAQMREEEVVPLIFAPGLSTSPIITEVSGRGIGLDVVRRNIEALQGRIEVRTARGVGTTFVLTLPFTVVSARCLLVRASGQVFAIPIAAVERLMSVTAADVAPVEGKQAIRYLGRPVPLVRLGDVLRLPGAARPLTREEKVPAVVLAAGEQRLAFLVDEFCGEQELVVKNLGRQLSRVPNIAGATILGTGEVVLILNAPDLIKSAQQSAGPSLVPPEAEEEAAEERKVILIVDDSITTRTLEKNILTTAGYKVRLAIDGQEALSALTEDECDLVVADIDMPRLDGFELTERIKQDERFRDLPVILVTSYDSPEHKARGIEAGADAYIVKGSFDQDVLLQTIRQLI